MTLDLHAASVAIDACAVAVVVLGVLVAGTRSIARSIWMTAVQSIVVGVMGIAVGLAAGVGYLVAGGLLAFALKGVAVPLVLSSILRRSSVRQERRPIVSPRVTFVVAIALVFVATDATAGARLESSLGAAHALPAAISTLLTGLLILMTRRKALSLVVGLLVFENGIALAAFSLAYAMPLVVGLGALFDLLIVVVVAWVYARRMLDVFGTLSTDELRNLRG